MAAAAKRKAVSEGQQALSRGADSRLLSQTHPLTQGARPIPHAWHRPHLHKGTPGASSTLSLAATPQTNAKPPTLSIPQAEELSQCPGPRTPLISCSFQQWPRPRSGLDKTTQRLWLRGALHRHGLTQMDRWSLSDTPASSGPAELAHSAQEPRRKHGGPQHRSTWVHSVGLSARRQHGPQETQRAGPVHPVRSQLPSELGQTTMEEVFLEPPWKIGRASCRERV